MDEAEWIGVTEAAELTGYSAAHVRFLCRQHKLVARKIGARVWLIGRGSLMWYKAMMNHSRADDDDAPETA